MGNLEKLSAVLTEWLSIVASSVLPKVSITPTSGIGRVMNGFFGVDLSTYSIWIELGFLAKPAINSFVQPMLIKYLSFMPEEKIKSTALEMVGAMVRQAETKGYVNLFGIQIGKNAFDDLYAMIENMEG
jgi:hypothetical protein